MDGLGSTLLLVVLKMITFVYDFITYPIYLVIQKPWKVRALSRKIRAVIVDAEGDSTKNDFKIAISNDSQKNDQTKNKSKAVLSITKDTTSITFRSIQQPGSIHTSMVQENIDTMTKVFDWATKKYPNKRCLGTREILSEDDEVQPNGRVFKKYNLGDYKWKTYLEVNRIATQFGKGLRELGNESKKNVVIFAETREEWMIAAQALFKENIPLVTIYATLGDEAIAHGINETEVTTVITSYDLMPKFKQILKHTPKVDTLIYMPDQLKKLDVTGFKEGVQIINFHEVTEKGANSSIVSIPPTIEDISIIMYTSGSTGVPKGVILLHKNLIASLKAFSDSTKIYEEDLAIAFLPLAHVFELLVESVCLLISVPIGYSGPLTMIDSGSKVKKNSKGDATILHPTGMTCVPLILDRVSKSIQDKVGKSSYLKRVLFKFAYEYKESWKRRGFSTPLIDKMIFNPIRAILGGEMRLIISGGAPLSPETHEQINNCLCVKILQGYGLTETCSAATVMDDWDMSFGRVGPPITVCDIKLVNWEEGNYRVTDKPYPRGEIIVGGDNISAGYYKLPDKTEECFYESDGKRWFQTGDIGEIQEDGVLKIIDRKKDLVKLQAGEYVSLGKVEAELKTNSLVDNICVYGESSKDYCVALLVANEEQLVELATKIGINKTFEELCKTPEIEKLVQQQLAEHGKKCKLQKFEIPGAVKLVTEVWSPEMGLVTAAFKLKRKDIQERYKSEIEMMYTS